MMLVIFTCGCSYEQEETVAPLWLSEHQENGEVRDGIIFASFPCLEHNVELDHFMAEFPSLVYIG